MGDRLGAERRLLALGALDQSVAGLRLDNGLPMAAATGEPAAGGQRVGDRGIGSLAVARARDGGIRWPDALTFLPELVGEPPEAFLQALTDRYRQDPSDDNADLVAAAINRVGASERLRAAHADAVLGAKDLLHTGAGLADPSQADDIWFEVYTDVDYGGPEWFTSMTPGWAYWRTPDFRQVRAVYANVAMQDVVSSLQYGSSPTEAGGHVILFEHVRYDGRYRSFTVPSGGRVDVPWIGADFNDLTSSSLIVRRFPNELPPVRMSQVLPKATITSALAGVPRVSPDGDPIYTWDMWPDGPRSGSDWHPNDDNAFVEIVVPVVVAMPDPIADYRAQVKYWVLPGVRDGRLTATVAYWGYWVEGGMFTDVVAAILRLALPHSVAAVQGRIDAAVGPFARLGRLDFCYLLPGRNDERGHVFDDVTIVGVR
jgi:hypothetical protein